MTVLTEKSHIPVLPKEDVTDFLLQVGGKLLPGSHLSAEQPYDSGIGVRQILEDVMSGQQDIVRLGEDFYLVTNSGRVEEDFYDRTIGDGWMTLHFRLRGETIDNYTGYEQVQRNPSYCYVTVHPEGMERGALYRKGDALSLSLSFRANTLTETLSLNPAELPAPIRSFIERGDDQYLFMPLRFTASMGQSVKETLACPLEGSIRRLFVESKSCELLVSVLDAISKGGKSSELPVVLRPSDERRIEQARDFILSRLADPPSISTLVRQIGINRNKLGYGFKHMYGLSISEFCLQQRMELARELLKDKDRSISSVA